MRFSEIISEKFIIKSSKVIDRRSNEMNWNGEPREQMIVLTKDGGAILYSWGQVSASETMAWASFITEIRQEMDTSLQKDVTEISLRRDGNILISENADDFSFGGIRSQYNKDVSNICRAILDRGLATPETKVYIGNWARDASEAELLGTIKQLCNLKELPNQIVLYHGTSSYRLEWIMEHGLTSVNKELRIWTGNRKDPIKNRDGNDNAIFLTPSKNRADYYANQAVKQDNRKYSPKKLQDLKAALANQIAVKAYFEKQLGSLTNETEKANLQKHIANVEKNINELTAHVNTNFEGNIEPVILKVVVKKSQYKYFAPDDDFKKVQPKGTTFQSQDWIRSLKEHGQVAFLGTIPPSEITVVSQK